MCKLSLLTSRRFLVSFSYPGYIESGKSLPTLQVDQRKDDSLCQFLKVEFPLQTMMVSAATVGLKQCNRCFNNVLGSHLSFRIERITLELTGQGATERLRWIRLDAKVASRGSGPTIC